ncbi:MAG TPA: PIN domain-containing protein [Vicinamibacteria bacterium]|nr:PIN domain-containing protein [Vicinamibacteria bacterium]
MSIVLDTGVVYAYYDRRDSWHRKSVDLMKREPGQFVLPSPVIPEVDHLLGVRLGSAARRTFYLGLINSSYFISDVPPEGYQRILDLNDHFNELELGFVDASVVTIAEALGLRRIATTDRRHFEPLRKPFRLELLPE